MRTVDSQAARDLLAAIMFTPDYIEAVVSLGITAADFIEPRNQSIFEAMVRLNTAAKEAEIVNLKGELDACGKLMECGGVDYLISIAESASPPIDPPSLARKVMAESLERQWASA